jgi:hypothetical protein
MVKRPVAYSVRVPGRYPMGSDAISRSALSTVGKLAVER